MTLHNPWTHQSPRATGSPLSNSIFPSNQFSESPRSEGQVWLTQFIEVALGNSSSPINSGIPVLTAFQDRWQGLPPRQQRQVQEYWGTSVLRSLQFLAHEPDPELFISGMLNLARAQAHAGRRDRGLAILTLVQRHLEEEPALAGSLSSGLTGSLESEFQALSQTGPLSGRLEYLAEDVLHGALAPTVLASFFVGAGAFQLGRAAFLTRALRSPSSMGLTRALAVRLGAPVTGILAESTAFTLTHRSLQHLQGVRVNWSPSALGAEVLGMGIFLGLARGAGALGPGILTPLSRQPGWNGSWYQRVSEAALPQSLVFGSVVAAHQVQGSLGLRPQLRGENLWVESLSTYLQFTLAGSVFRNIQPRSFSRWVEGMEVTSQARLRESLRQFLQTHNQDSGGFPGALAVVGAGRAVVPGRVSEIQDHISMMSRPKKAGEVEPPEHLGYRSSTRLKSGIEERAVALEHLPIPVLITDFRGKIVYGNLQAVERLAQGQIGILGKRMNEFFNEIPGEPNILRLNGKHREEPVFYESITQPLPGMERFSLHTLRDVTLQREQAREIFESRRFSHDVANLYLLVTLWASRGLPKLTEVFREHAEKTPMNEHILSQSDQMATNIRDIEALFLASNALARHNKIHLEDYDLTSVLESAASRMEYKRHQGETALEMDIEPGLQAYGSYPYMLTTISNLLRNSYQAMRDSGGVVTLRARRDGQDILIEVQDNGPGIPPQHLSRIFQTGFSTKSEGNGLGLASAKETIEVYHKGQIEVDSTVGEGTTFRIRIPYVDSQ